MINTSAQHDHHCLVVASGTVLRIAACRGPIIETTCVNGCCTITLDSSGMDFDRYCAAAVMNDYANAAAIERGGFAASARGSVN